MLEVTVAPATATAMRPLLDYWPAGGTVIWLNTTEEQLFPSELNETHAAGSNCSIASLDDDCPSAGWESLGENLLSYMPLLRVSPDQLGLRLPDTMQIRARNTGLRIWIEFRQPVYDRYTFNYTVSTTQHAVIAEALAQNTRLWDLAARNSTSHGETKFFYRTDTIYSMNSHNPLVHVRCEEPITIGNNSPSIPQFPNLGDENFRATEVLNTEWQRWIDFSLGAVHEPNLLWVDLPSDIIGRSSIGAIITTPGNSDNERGEVWGCSVDARWAGTRIWSGGMRRFTEGIPQHYSIQGPPLQSWPGQDYYSRVRLRPGLRNTSIPEYHR